MPPGVPDELRDEVSAALRTSRAVVDEVRVLRLLRKVTDDLAVLRAAAEADDARRSEPMWLRGVKYTLVTAVGSCVAVAQHVCASEGWGPPTDNGDAMTLLGRHGVLDVALASRMRQAVELRGVLVHDCAQVDDRVVLDRLADPSDLRRFAESVAAWLRPVG